MTCVTGPHASADTYSVLLSVRGESAVCGGGDGACTYEYIAATTPTLSSAAWTSNDAGAGSWVLALGGSGFGDAPVVKVG